MNKYKKIATAVVATVMAGTMVFGLTACGDKDNGPSISGGTSTLDNITKPTNLASNLTPKVDANDHLTFASQTQLNMNVGNQNKTVAQGIKYGGAVSGAVQMPDGVSYSSDDLKPAWKALGEKMDIKFVDTFQNLGSGDQIKNAVVSTTELQKYDVITGGLSNINENSENFLNIADYLYYMPNYVEFLKTTPSTMWSLTGDGNTGAMYAAPYFDGNDDIEKYELFRREWVKKILDSTDVSAATGTFADQATAKNTNKPTSGSDVVGDKATVESYMGTTGHWDITTTDPASTSNGTTTLRVDYSAALTAAKKSGEALNTALKDAGLVDAEISALKSGNIVDLQNAAINKAAGNITGAKLANILRAYIDVAYTKTDGTKFYTTRSDVFVSASAGWDVDLLVGLSRALVCSKALLDSTTAGVADRYLWAIAARQPTNQRRADVVALAGELYGIRGLESRLEVGTFIDANGVLQDSRLDAETYNLLNKFHQLTVEGLLCVDDTDDMNGKNYPRTGAKQALLIHDYSQTQTNAAIGSDSLDGWDFAPCLVPVSKWDTDNNGTRETIMRFTESYRATKNTGFCIPKVSVTGNADKLSAVLAFVDYLFSPDGQLLMTYGTPTTTAAGSDGWWKGAVASGVTIDQVADKTMDELPYLAAQYKIKDQYKSQYFVYDGKVYTGFPYMGRVVPEITEASANAFNGTTTISDLQVSIKGNYTNYARYIVGTTLPIGNKDQGFEYQCTAECGLDGADIVSSAMLNGTVNHLYINPGDIVKANKTLWYMIVPTALPLSAAGKTEMKSGRQTTLMALFPSNSTTDSNRTALMDVFFYGLGASNKLIGDDSYPSVPQTGTAFVDYLKGSTLGLNIRHGYQTEGWTMLNNFYKIFEA